MGTGDNCIVIDDKPVEISGIKQGSIHGFFIHNNPGGTSRLAMKTGLGAIILVEARYRLADGRLGPQHGLVFFTMTIDGKVHYLTPTEWKELEKKDIPFNYDFPEDAVCIPVNHRGFPMM